jgi:nucleotide-binding universal stress UspA family protein
VRSPERVLVVCEHSRAGAAAIDFARELAEDEHVAVTVVGVAPQAPSGSRCGNSATEFNDAVADSVVQDLEQARAQLGRAAERACFQLLIEGAPPSLVQFAADGGFDLVLLPAHRRPLRAAYHPHAKRLGQVPGAEIRLVDRRGADAGGSGAPPRAPLR